MQRYFVNENKINLKTKLVTIEGNDHHHIKNVMKMHVNERVILCDGECHEYLCLIKNISDVTTLEIIDSMVNENELNGYVSIAQGLVKKAKCDEVLRRIVELGASEYFNVITDYSVIKEKDNDNKYLERRKTIVKEASEQSERGRLLNLLETKSFNEFLKYANNFDNKICAYEENGRNGINNLNSSIDFYNKKTIVIVGPEGGFSNKEVELLKNNGFVFVSLGKRILRTETAPLYLMSVIGYLIDGVR